MTRFVRLNSRMYASLLYLYPRDLRREFGDEMLFAFLSELRDRGALKVWLCAVSEAVRIGIPGHREDPRVAVPVFTFTLNLALSSLSSVVGHTRESGVPFPVTAQLFGYLLLAVITALVSYVVVRLSESNAPIRLPLARS